MRLFRCAGLFAIVAGASFAQSAAAPKFDVADVHLSPKTPRPFMRINPTRNGRYEIRNATMLDLIRTAYGFNQDTIIGGPNWIELDHFDVIGKVPAGSDSEAPKAMLQALLEDRFKLVANKETKPVTTWVLAPGKQPHLKEADGSGQTGCKVPDASGPPAEGAIRLFSMGQDGKQTQINLGAGGVIQYTCRNMTMAAFAAELRGMLGTRLGPEPIGDETGLKGSWNFDFRYSIGLIPIGNQGGEQISLADAIDKQLGLKLEQRQVPKPVLTIASVNRTPSPNPPDLAEVLPPLAAPAEFEVADVKLAAPLGPGFPGIIGFQMQPGGRFRCNGCPMRLLLNQAFNTNNNEMLIVPAGVEAVRVDITAKTSSDTPAGPAIDNDVVAPLLRSLLADRFKMTYHNEERQVTAYSLIAAKPKLKKADPESRIFCRRGQAAPGAPPGSQTLTCQNATMAFFADQLLQASQGLNWPVIDATGIEGGWDFTLTFSNLPPGLLNRRPAGADAGPGALPDVADPSGGYTIFESIEKQLGLKLKAEKRPEQVIVIDHMESKPTEN